MDPSVLADLQTSPCTRKQSVRARSCKAVGHGKCQLTGICMLAESKVKDIDGACTVKNQWSYVHTDMARCLNVERGNILHRQRLQQ